MPEVDVPPVASIAAIAVVGVDYQQLTLQLAHHHAGLAYQKFPPVLEPSAAEPGGAVPRDVKT